MAGSLSKQPPWKCGASNRTSNGSSRSCPHDGVRVLVVMMSLYELFEVEKDSGCQKILLEWFNDGCIFGDVMKMIKNTVSDTKLLDPKKVKFRESSWCARHQKECQHSFTSSAGGVGIIGAPCILFSKKLACTSRLGIFGTALGTQIQCGQPTKTHGNHNHQNCHSYRTLLPKEREM